MKILFLAANPIDVASRIRIDKEIREISQKISKATLGDQLHLVSEWAVRPDDLQEILMRHKPDIVHFSGHATPSSGIVLEDEHGKRKVVSREALAELFRILKGNIRVVVLNACYAKDQAEALASAIDFTIGMNAPIEDKAATIFAARFYELLAFGYSVKDAFELAVNQQELVASDAAQVPVLLARPGANATKVRIVEPSRGKTVAVLFPLLLGSLALILTTDSLRRFLNSDGWLNITSLIIQSSFVILAIVVAAIMLVSVVHPAHPFVVKALGSGVLKARQKIQTPTIATGFALVFALGAWLCLPVFARYYNERGTRFQYSDVCDLTGARESYRKAVRLQPGFAQAHYNLATVEEDLDRENAIEEYRLAISSDSRIYPAYNNLARLYLLRGNEKDFESALNLLSQAEVLAPQDENVQYSLNKNLGWANYALKHNAIAEGYLRRAIALRSQQGGAAAHCLLAYVLKEEDKAGAADECFDCVSLAPGEKDVEPKWISDAQDCLNKGGAK